ncbi:hypothetical protein M1O55_01055 [Dehalococcoidia bacterium]|jgi:hypothetical protein|nr:hypothetical protein [Dehalococcoidia bacterium]
MPEARFDLNASDINCYWFEKTNGGVSLNQTADNSAGGEDLLTIELEELRNLLIWADDEGTVTTVFNGPMANEIKKSAQELAITEEMFIWHAVKLFMEVGSSGQY